MFPSFLSSYERNQRCRIAELQYLTAMVSGFLSVDISAGFSSPLFCRGSRASRPVTSDLGHHLPGSIVLEGASLRQFTLTMPLIARWCPHGAPSHVRETQEWSFAFNKSINHMNCRIRDQFMVVMDGHQEYRLASTRSPSSGTWTTSPREESVLSLSETPTRLYSEAPFGDGTFRTLYPASSDPVEENC